MTNKSKKRKNPTKAEIAEVAEAMAWALDMGLNCYFDSCKWNEKAKKYRYYSADMEKVYYYSKKFLYHWWDKELLPPHTKKEILEDYREVKAESKLREAQR